MVCDHEVCDQSFEYEVVVGDNRIGEGEVSSVRTFSRGRNHESVSEMFAP